MLARLEAMGEHGAAVQGLDGDAPLDGAQWLLREPRERRAAVTRPVDSGGLGKGLGLRWAFRVARARAPEARA